MHEARRAKCRKRRMSCSSRPGSSVVGRYAHGKREYIDENQEQPGLIRDFELETACEDETYQSTHG